MGRDVRKFGGCLGTPIWNTYQEMYMCPPPLVGSEELGGGWGRIGPSRREGMRLDCLSCNAGVSCKNTYFLFQGKFY